ncbi:hypothetical protein M407DRAFT_245555 [Tulasnella calospora MUT 4182]|uniref:Uncharacterized protein n=1 Tax=Tulasnella calospora MUT 4182 TaxID=1051891 RepID=A0A0C3KI67_9AGAM|nr:hypothetical protein M407DRAFT_245555 [Tulasnella calospora MUT 4182]
MNGLHQPCTLELGQARPSSANSSHLSNSTCRPLASRWTAPHFPQTRDFLSLPRP